MPFKGIHGHTRHTHEDKIEKKKPKEDVPPKHAENEGQPTIKKEMDLYNTPFEPFVQNKPAHYVNRFFRRSAQTVVHCVLALSPHFYMHTDELFDWMMPYERMGALLSEDAEDYINRKMHQQQLKQKHQNQVGNEVVSEREPTQPHPQASAQSSEINSSTPPPHYSSQPLGEQGNYTNMANSVPAPASVSNMAQAPSHTPSSDTYSMSSSSFNSSSSSQQDHQQISSIFSSAAHNPQTDHEIQVNPKNPNQAVQSKVSHFHPPFLIIDSRRDDEYKESHIHGAVNIHYEPPRPGKKFEFALPSWVEKDTPVITYCAVGLRSGLMVWELRKRGYRFVKVLSGGYYKWVNEGRPIYAHTGELTEKVLQQHKLAGLMLRRELKSQQKKLNRKQEMDARVATHHQQDSDWPACHTYKPCPDQKRKSLLTVGMPHDERRSSLSERRSSFSEHKPHLTRRSNSLVGTSAM